MALSIRKTTLKLNKNELIKMALEKTAMRVLTFDEFIQITEIPLDKIMVDRMFHSITEDIPIYLDNTIIEYFGYKGSRIKQKQSIKDLIKKNFSNDENIAWWRYKNAEYEKFLLTGISPDIPPCENLIYEYSYMENISKKQMYPPCRIIRQCNTSRTCYA